MHDSLQVGAHSQHHTRSSANLTEENSNLLSDAEFVGLPLMAQGRCYNTFECEVFTVHVKGQIVQSKQHFSLGEKAATIIWTMQENTKDLSLNTVCHSQSSPLPQLC